MIEFDSATQAQISAANPFQNTWVTANAGSGKTRVLTDRVARLLFHNTKPGRILCLTYTKSAAAEMQNRLFNRLGKWAMMKDQDLANALQQLGEDVSPSDHETLQFARTLFAAALETPGGLKIQTIHSFCEAILRQFPLEANVSPRFEVLEERKATQFRLQILDDLASQKDKSTIDAFARYYTKDNEADFLAEVIAQRDRFANIPNRKDFGLFHNQEIDDLRNDLISASQGVLHRLLELTKAAEGTNDKKTHRGIKAFIGGQVSSKDFQRFEAVFLTKSSGYMPKLGKVPTQGSLDKNDPLRREIDNFAERVQAFRKERLAILAYNRANALHKFARGFLALYDDRKAKEALLDYDDLIRKTRTLLKVSATAQWVLYRLDGGLDHILVDEAQDTSPAQWEIIEQLHDEFTTHELNSDRKRTIFIVGDEKQSIYSFQGADPAIFDKKLSSLKAKLQGIKSDLSDAALLHSFRSAPPILQLVDQVFSEQSETGIKAQHLAFHENMPGQVELWPAILEKPKNEPSDWYKPGGHILAQSPARKLADRIAKFIKDQLESGKTIEVEENGERIIRAIKPSDFLILFRTRKPLFHQVINALKAYELPVAGTDRLKISQELAVKDVLACLRFLNTADDDLSLAEALRSPIFGLSESDLFKLAFNRGSKTLWQVLRNSDAFPDILKIIQSLRASVDFARPNELIEQVLYNFDGRKNLIARLGPEVEDALEELQNLALEYESVEPPSLTGFLQWMSNGEVEIKRENNSELNQIRVMSVHGAKGLESPIVILPDTIDSKSQGLNKSIATLKGSAIWRSNADDLSVTQETIDAEAKDANFRESMRLLYVALTRAESWLIICGAGTVDKINEGNWYARVRKALDNLSNGEPFCNEPWRALPNQKDAQIEECESSLPTWFNETPPKGPDRVLEISPSNLPGPKALPNEKALTEAEAMARGTRIHLLLEQLPERPKETRKAFALKLLGEGHDDEIEEALRVINKPELTFLFARNSLSEQAVSTNIKEGVIYGMVDRLIIEDGSIMIVDYKTNSIVPQDSSQIPTGLLAQLGAYAICIQKLYPDHEIKTSILWTSSANLMSVPHNQAINAFNAALTLDQSVTDS